MSDERVLFTSVDPLAWMEGQPDKHTSLVAFNERMDDLVLELDSLAELGLSETRALSSQQQEKLIIDPLSTSPIKPTRPLEENSVLARDVRSLRAVAEGISALVKLCDCSIHEAVYSFHVCSGNVLRAKHLLEGKRGPPWTLEEDRLLLSRSLKNYYTLLQYRTPDDLKRRLDYFTRESS